MFSQDRWQIQREKRLSKRERENERQRDRDRVRKKEREKKERKRARSKHQSIVIEIPEESIYFDKLSRFI